MISGSRQSRIGRNREVPDLLRIPCFGADRAERARERIGGMPHRPRVFLTDETSVVG